MSYTKGWTRKLHAVPALGLLISLANDAHASKFDVPVADLDVRWDNTVRYNLGVRAENRDSRIVNNPLYDSSDLKFDRGDVVTNRLDLLSELDLVYQGAHGFRVSAAGWYDQAYHDRTAEGNPLFGPPGAYPGGRYTNYVNRYNHGPSGELLDAFVFTKFNLGDVPVNLKLGKHTNYWGESLFSLSNSIAYSQGPVDVIKATANPGSQAKELFMPISQISGQAQLSSTLSVAASYSLDWKPWRLPDGGTYFGSANFFSVDGGTVMPGGLPFAGASDRPDKRSDWGVMARWSPEWMEGTVGFYYREFADKLPWVVFAPGFTSARLAYAGNTRLYGLSLAKQVAGASIGAEISYRKDTALNSNAAVADQGALGDTWHALANAIIYFGDGPLWSSAPLTAELNFTRLDKVTRNAALLPLAGTAACASPAAGVPGGVADGCVTRNAWALNLAFEPVWYQALAGVDLKAPLSYSIGLKGNAASLGGSRKGNGAYSLGLTAEVQNRYFISLKYNDYLVRFRDNGTAVTTDNGGGALYSDRGWVSLTFQTSF
jgi:hypothetical protein